MERSEAFVKFKKKILGGVGVRLGEGSRVSEWM